MKSLQIAKPPLQRETQNFSAFWRLALNNENKVFPALNWAGNFQRADMHQIVEMIQDGDGVWQYTDPDENDLVWELEQISGMNLSAYDSLLNDAPKWVGHESKRQMLAGLRLELGHHCRQHYADTERLELQVKIYHQAFDMVRMQITGMVLALKDVRRKSQSKEAAKRERPNAVSQFRLAIIAAMRSNKPDCENFKTFMAMWEIGHLDGLTIKTINDNETYVITDENGTFGEVTYSRGSLQTMYSNA
jgi:hypothetical protein